MLNALLLFFTGGLWRIFQEALWIPTDYYFFIRIYRIDIFLESLLKISLKNDIIKSRYFVSCFSSLSDSNETKKNIPSSKALQPEHDQANQLMLVFFTVFKEKQFPEETYTDPCQISTAKSR